MTKRVLEKIAASDPVDRTAALVTGRGPRYVPDKKILTADQPTPHPTMPFPGPLEHDLTGASRGRLTVVGFWAGNERGKKIRLWVTRCVCGTYTLRRTKSIKNPANDVDACEGCRHAAYLRRHDRYRSGHGEGRPSEVMVKQADGESAGIAGDADKIRREDFEHRLLPTTEVPKKMTKRALDLRFRVDAYCSGGWQHRASFAGEADTYEYGEQHTTSGARVWDGDDCIAVTYARRSWHAPRHNRNCNGKPCECGAVASIGSMARGECEVSKV